jgi:hypothetical protein
VGLRSELANAAALDFVAQRSRSRFAAVGPARATASAWDMRQADKNSAIAPRIFRLIKRPISSSDQFFRSSFMAGNGATNSQTESDVLTDWGFRMSERSRSE